MTAVAPGSASRIGNAYYKTEEELLYACADAMREEYKAILDAGLILQLDDPAIAENWDMINPEPTVEEYKKFSMVRVEALNHAIRGLPQDRIRFHLCWGSWHGPHVTDIAMRDIVDVMLAINVRAYSFEAGNVRHEHEWKVWQDVKLPDDKLILPGVVSHATNVVEHPELVAERILRFANLVGRGAGHRLDRLRARRPRSIRRSPGPSSKRLVAGRRARHPPALGLKQIILDARAHNGSHLFRVVPGARADCENWSYRGGCGDRDLDLSEIQSQAGPRRGKRRVFLLGFWRDEGPD